MSENSSTLLDGIFGTTRSSIQAMINRTCIVSYGIVKEIIADGIIAVEISVADNKDDLQVITCVLANIASEVITVNVTPTIGDKVLVLFPNKFDPDMFDKEKDEAIISESPCGYDLFSGIAILVNQYQTKYHHNLVDVAEDGAITLSLAYNEDDEENLLVLTTNADGELTLNSNNNTFSLNKDGEVNIGVAYSEDDEKALVTLDVNKDGEIALNSNDKYTLDVNKDGEVAIKSNDIKVDLKKDKSFSIDTSKAKVTIDSSGNVTIDAMSGKLSLKNSSASLYTILNGMFQILNSSLATAGSPASHTVVPQQFAQQSTQLGQLMK